MSDFDIQALIKNQRKEASYLDSEYTVVVSGGGAEDNVEKPKFKALLPGVRLHFLRYGLFPKEAEVEDEHKKSGAVRVKDNSDEEFTFSDAEATNSNVASTDKFMLGKTILNQGYVYLINVDDDTDCHELEVGPDGKMSHIIWDKDNFYPSENIPKDKRIPEEKEDLHYKLIINEGEEGEARSFWVSYSPVQWSYAMFLKTLEMTDEQRKERGMVLVSSAGIQKDQEPAEEYIVAYDKLVYAYDRSTKKQYNYKTQIEQVIAQEKAEDRKGNNTVYEDMFIALHDPIGAAKDIQKELQAQTGEFTALVESIQTGESQEEALKRLADNKPRPKVKDHEYRAMVSLALTSYLMVYTQEKKISTPINTNSRSRRRRSYNTNSNSKYDGGVQGWNAYGKDRDFQYGDQKRARSGAYNPDRDWSGKNGLDRSKVEGILGVDVRSYKRKAVQAMRNELGNFIKTKYFRAVNDFYLGSNECKIEGACLNIELYGTLFVNPFDIDKGLLLPQDYKAEDSWQDFVFDALTEGQCMEYDEGEFKSIMPEYADKDTLYALINTKTSLNTEKAKSGKEDIANKFAAATKGFFEFISKHELKDIHKFEGNLVHEIPKRLQVIVDRLKQKVEIDGKPAFAFENNQIYLKLKAQGARLDDAFILAGAPKKGWTAVLTGDGGAELLAKDRTGVNSHRKRKPGEKMVRAKYTVEVPAIERIKLTTREQLAFRAEKFVNGKAFTGTLAVLQIFNIKAALSTVANDPTWKNSIGAVGVGFELKEAVRTFQIAALQNVKSFDPTKLVRSATRAGIYANVFTTIICGWEMVNAFDRRDTDAAVAFGLAAVAYGVATIASFEAGAALIGLAFGGPVAWIALGIGFGLVTIGYLLTDTEAETYFKNFLLSDHCKKYYRPKTKDYDPVAYTRLLIDKKKVLVDDEDYEDTLMHPQDAEAKLFDLTTCNSMVFEPHGKKETQFLGDEMPMAYTTQKANSYTIRLAFNHFFQDINQAEYGALIFEDNETNAIHLDTTQFIQEKKVGNELVLKVAIPRKYRKITCQLLIVVRLVIDRDNEMYFPYPLKKNNGSERWLGARVPINHAAGLIIPENFMSSENVKYDTLENLKKVNQWQNWVERLMHGTNEHE